MIGFQIKRTLKSGVKSLWLHKLRSGLTVLGITFGVCSVIAMLAIGTGASEEAQEQIRKLGSQNIIIQSIKPPESQEASEGTTRVLQYGLTNKDADLIATMPGVEKTTRARKVRGTITRGSSRFDTFMVGAGPQYLDVKNSFVQRGRFLTVVDMEDRSAACVLGRGAADVLFPLGDALGSYIRKEAARFKVVGVISSLGHAEVGGATLQGDPNSEVYIPLTTMRTVFSDTNIVRTSGQFSRTKIELHELVVKVGELEDVRPLEKVIRHILGTSHKKADYQIIVPLQLLVQARRTKRIFSIVLGSIAAISLLVGGIGIMNISLATVMERTREIGIRRAMGAKRRHIIFQFLTETLLLALFGGGLGIVLGVLAPYFVERFAGMRTIVTPWSLILAFGISAAIGLTFGIYPAYRAANMDPIEALRHE